MCRQSGKDNTIPKHLHIKINRKSKGSIYQTPFIVQCMSIVCCHPLVGLKNKTVA